jgi:hypothetical protein
VANTVYIRVDNLATVLLTYDVIKVYRSLTEDGVFSEVTTLGTRPILNAQDNLYTYIDNTGVATDFYKTAFFHETSLVESAQSAASQAMPLAQLAENMQVVITVSEDIEDIDGNPLGEDQEFYFTTTYNPMYSAIRRIRLDIGSFLKNTPDDTINLAIFEASIEADHLTFDKNAAAMSNLYLHARRQYVTCKAEQILLNNLINGAGGMLKSKRLADFSVEYSDGAIKNILAKVEDCIARWEPELMTGGHAVQTPRGVVKGEMDIDRPNVGRGWDTPDGYPVGNARVLYRGSRRWRTGYIPKGRTWDDE